MQNFLVRDWMTPNPVTATPSTTLPEALELMKKHKIRRLPVVDDGQVVGIVTRGDLRGAQPSQATSLSIFELNYLIGRITLNQIMTRKVVTIPDTATIQDAAQLMLQHKLAGLPVLRAGELVGIITESDIFRLVVRMWAPTQALPVVVH
jgi:CBS domain-containing protein